MLATLIDWLQEQGACGQIESAKPLTGGYWNAVYRLQGEAFDLVLKQFADSAPGGLFPVLPAAEARALEQLQGTGVAPLYHSYWPQAPGGAVLLYEFVPGHMWQGDMVATAKLFKRLHSATVAGPFRQLTTQPVPLLQQADDILGGYLVQALGRQLADLRPDDRQLDAIDPVLVHTDSGPGNIIQSGQQVTFIDFQCPGLGDACEDLVCFLSPGIHYLYGLPALSCVQEQTYLQAYGDTQVLARLPHIRPYYSYRLAAYFVMRYYSQQGLDNKVAEAYLKAAQLEMAALESCL